MVFSDRVEEDHGAGASTENISVLRVGALSFGYYGCGQTP